MSSGRLAATTLTSGSNVVIYTCSATLATINLNICNISGSQKLVSVAISSGSLGSLTDSDWVEYRYPLEGNGVLERTGFVLSTSQSIIGTVDGTGVVVTVWGIEE